MIQQVYLTNSCPLINAKAVFGARNLLNTVFGFKFYDDRTICNASGYAYKKGIESNPETTKTSETQWDFYPNPAIDRFFISLSNKIEGDILISVYDLAGRSLLEFKEKSLDKLYSLATESLSNGYYTLQITNNKAVVFITKMYVLK